MKVWRRRDLTIVSGIGNRKSLVIACDSCGGIGNKDGDVYKLSPYYVGKLTVRVGLTEVLASGSTPFVVANGVACEMKPTGEEIIKGIQDELKSASLQHIEVTGSTEENFPTVMTATGITVAGICNDDEMRFKKASANDVIILLGVPQVGGEVDLFFKGFYNEIRFLLSLHGVREIIPVGSKGIAYECMLIGELNGLKFRPHNTSIDFYKPGGPVSCIIAVCDESAVALALSLPNAVTAGFLY